MARMGKNSGLGSILGSAFPGDMSNSTSPVLLPTQVLEAFIPGYGYLHRFVLYSIGFDVTSLVSFGALLWVAIRAGKSLYAGLIAVVYAIWTSEITINSTDEIHSHLIQFLAHQFTTKSSRKLLAETPAKTAWELDNEAKDSPETTTDADGNIKWLNFSNQEKKTRPRFTPALGATHSFWHNGTYFTIRRKEVSIMDSLGGNSGATFKDRETLTMLCYGRSTKPIKKLIQHAKEHYHLGHNVKTVIKRPSPKDMRRFGGRGSWMKIAERPCRPMKTVVLDEDRKMDVLADINEYLNPATAQWYANRGIPYRRGYLFHGPPGTGKTSLTFALAGVFGLDIHVISLLEPTLTEEELGMLFTNLPARCIVLLEDIDTAGLVRNDKKDEDQGPAPGQTKDEWNVVNLTKAIKKANDSNEKKEGITLSGLLNIIDGVASHEGRVLVMTTNRPEQLDDALIRPGRVDHQVAFSNATQSQIKELFERMYSIDLPPTARPAQHLTIDPTNSHTSKLQAPLTPPGTPITGAPVTAVGIDGLSTEELSDIAKDFASEIPDDMMSPAEIQGFLLKRKKDPRKALREVKAWVEGRKEQKELKTKLVSVQ